MPIKVAVLAINAEGAREILQLDIVCSDAQIEEGEHYEIAATQAANSGYTPLGQFDENDPAWTSLGRPAYERGVNDDRMALAICAIAAIKISPSQEEENQGLWTWTGPHGHACESDLNSEEDAALNAVSTVFPVSDWQYQVENQDTRQGYFEWALSQANLYRDEPESATERQTA